MLSSRRSRAGTTLVELIVALTLAAVVLATATSSVLRQRRTSWAIADHVRASQQRRAALGALQAELSALGMGDIAPREARDTSLQLRMLVATGVACDDGDAAATFAGDDGSFSPGSPPKLGDTLWWYGGAQPVWRGRRVVSSDSVSAPCLLDGTSAAPARRVRIAASDTIPLGALLRVSRQARYAFYRSGDGSWQLGFRDWLETNGAFPPPQPVAGPFVMRDGSARTGFRYFDAPGTELPVGAMDADAALVARVRVTVLSSAAVGSGRHRDSVDVALLPARAP